MHTAIYCSHEFTVWPDNTCIVKAHLCHCTGCLVCCTLALWGHHQLCISRHAHRHAWWHGRLPFPYHFLLWSVLVFLCPYASFVLTRPCLWYAVRCFVWYSQPMNTLEPHMLDMYVYNSVKRSHGESVTCTVGDNSWSQILWMRQWFWMVLRSLSMCVVHNFYESWNMYLLKVLCQLVHWWCQHTSFLLQFCLCLLTTLHYIIAT